MIKTASALLVALAVGLASVPASAQSDNGGPVSGLGPGGSGAAQSSLGPSKAFVRNGNGPHRKHRHRRH